MGEGVVVSYVREIQMALSLPFHQASHSSPLALTFVLGGEVVVLF